jgi:hypothetical protein
MERSEQPLAISSSFSVINYSLTNICLSVRRPSGRRHFHRGRGEEGGTAGRVGPAAPDGHARGTANGGQCPDGGSDSKEGGGHFY